MAVKYFIILTTLIVLLTWCSGTPVADPHDDHHDHNDRFDHRQPQIAVAPVAYIKPQQTVLIQPVPVVPVRPGAVIITPIQHG